MSNNSLLAPIITGLVIGILLIAIFAFMFRPAAGKTDAELIAQTRLMKEVNYFLSKYPDAVVTVERWQNERSALVTYSVERQLCQPDPNRFGDNCIKSLMLSVDVAPLRSANSVLTCGGPISYSYGGDIIEEIENNDCFTAREPVAKASSKLDLALNSTRLP